MKRMTAIILAALLLAGCGSIEEESPQTKAPAAPVTEQTDDVAGETATFVMTTISGTTTTDSTPEKPKETTTTTATHTNLEEDIVMFTTSQENAAGLSDTADTFTREFLDSVTYAEYRDFDETRYALEGMWLDALKNELSTYHGKKCEDPVIDGWYSFVLKDNSGNEHYLNLAGNYFIFDGVFYHDPDNDKGGNFAKLFRTNGSRMGNDTEGATAEFELVQLRPGGKSGYVIHDTYGLTSFSLKDGSLEQLPAGTMLKITWSGMIAESYPSKLEGVTSVTRANDLANPDRPDFVTENLPALIEACRGKDDYSAEIEKLTGLKKCEKDALMWLVGNELFSETKQE